MGPEIRTGYGCDFLNHWSYSGHRDVGFLPIQTHVTLKVSVTDLSRAGRASDSDRALRAIRASVLSYTSYVSNDSYT